MKKVGEFWHSLSPQGKLIVILIILIILFVLRNKIKGSIQAAGKSIQNQSEVAVLQAHGIKATYSEDKYKKLADYLYRSMDGWGTDSEAVYNAFEQLRNDVDFILLDRAFGIRTASDNLFGLLEDEDLKGWIREDLSATEVQKLNTILKNRGITKRF